MVNDKILLTICARGGSKGVKDKNIRELCGIPLIGHTIRQAKRWGRAHRIICSTDSSQIAEVAKRYGAEVPFMRPAELATDTCGKIAVLRHALRTTEELTGEKFSILVDLDVTAPVRRIEDIEEAFQLFLKGRSDSVVSVTPARRNPYFNMLELQSDGYAAVVKKLQKPFVRRQDAPAVYDMNASIYVFHREYVLDEATTSSISKKTRVCVMEESSAFDIDSEMDFKLVEFMVSQKAVEL